MNDYSPQTSNKCRKLLVMKVKFLLFNCVKISQSVLSSNESPSGSWPNYPTLDQSEKNVTETNTLAYSGEEFCRIALPNCSIKPFRRNLFSNVVSQRVCDCQSLDSQSHNCRQGCSLPSDLSIVMPCLQILGQGGRDGQ